MMFHSKLHSSQIEKKINVFAGMLSASGPKKRTPTGGRREGKCRVARKIFSRGSIVKRMRCFLRAVLCPCNPFPEICNLCLKYETTVPQKSQIGGQKVCRCFSIHRKTQKECM